MIMTGSENMLTTAQSILNSSHPLNRAFMAFCKQEGIEPGKRQAQQFLNKYPFYQTIRLG